LGNLVIELQITQLPNFTITQFPSSSLSLFVFRVFADHPHYAFAVDDLAFVANLFYRCSDLHAVFPSNSSTPRLWFPCRCCY